MSRRRGGLDIGILLLGAKILQYGVDRIPPVTLATIIGNVVSYYYLPYPTHRVCISADSIWYDREWQRLFLGAIDHLNSFHLYYNMTSFLSKAVFLEKKFKSGYFAFLLAVFTLLTHSVLVGTNMLLAKVLHSPSYIHQCAVGFSGVIFALKVLTTHYNLAGTQLLMGFIPVPSKWACWAELILIQFLVPNASFTGHLAGILVGLLYVKGPLKMIMDLIYITVTGGVVPQSQSSHYSHNQSGTHSNNAGSNYSQGTRFHGSGTTGYAPPSPTPSAPYAENFNNNTHWHDQGNVPYNEEYQYGHTQAPYPPAMGGGQTRPSCPPAMGGGNLYPDLAEMNHGDLDSDDQFAEAMRRSLNEF